MISTLPDLDQNISKRAINVWRLSNILVEGIIYVILIGLLWTSNYFDWYQWITIILWVSVITAPLGLVWSIVFEPKFKQKYWKYGINEHFIYLKHGRFFSNTVVIPMTKVQYVEAEQGPLLRKYNLSTITIGTLGDKHTIPALFNQKAAELRTEIASHARLKEVES